MNGSILRSSFADRYFSASNPATAPWKRTGHALTSKRVIGPIPLLPSSTLFHAVSTVLPTGETMPRPVMTTRRFDKRLPLDAGHGSGVADSAFEPPSLAGTRGSAGEARPRAKCQA